VDNWVKILIKRIALFSLLTSTTINAQILSDHASIKLIKKGIDCIYNLKLDSAKEVYKKLNQLYPESPVVLIFKGTITYWENYPLLSTSSARTSFEEDMRSSIEQSEKNNNPSYEPEYLLANLCARALLMSFYADNDLSRDVFSLAASTYKLIRRSFGFTMVYNDFYFFTGLYNYYREAYPRAHPLYKSVAFLFPKGNRELGLKELQTASTNAVLLKAVSAYFQSIILMYYEINYQQALFCSNQLHELYPDNLEYLTVYLTNLLLLKKYDEAESLIQSSGIDDGNSYYKAKLSVFNGILQEKKYHNLVQAQEFYSTGIRDIADFGAYGFEFAAYAYFGLSRISEINGDKHSQKIYRKKANELAEIKKINFDD
jgi:hypothetical protein